MLRLRMIAEILEPRARELMYYVKESLRQGGVVDALGAGCVLTGGGAMLPGYARYDGEPVARSGAHGHAGAAFTTCRANSSIPALQPRLACFCTRNGPASTRAAEDNSLRAKLRAIFAASY